MSVRDPRDVLLSPVISEKSYGLLDENKYTFIVRPDANKTQIKIAVQQVFNVKVLAVNTKEAARKASPALLEPMMAVEVVTPEDNMGDVIGDLNSRRGTIQAMEERSGARVVRALVPLSEMFGYVGDLRSRTQGRASYTMVFDTYAEVPANVAKEIIAKATGE